MIDLDPRFLLLFERERINSIAKSFFYSFFSLVGNKSKRSPRTFSCVSSIHHNAYRRPSHTASSFNYKLPFTGMQTFLSRVSRLELSLSFENISRISKYPYCPPYFIFFDMRCFSFFQSYQYYPPGKFPIAIIL